MKENEQTPAEPASGQPASSQSGGVRAQVFGGGLMLVVRQIGTVALKIVGVLVITRLLGPAKYGAYVAAYGIFTFLLGVGQSGVGVFLVRQHGEITREQTGTATALLLGLSVGLVVIVEIFSQSIADYTRIPGFLETLRIMVLALPLQTLSIPALAKIERNMDLKGVAVVELTSQGAYYLLAVPLAFMGFGAVALAISLILQYALTFVLTYVIARQKFYLAWDGKMAAHIFRYTFSFSLSLYIWQMRALVNPFILGPVLGASAVGIVGMAIGVLEALTTLRGMIWRVTIAALAKVQFDPDKMRRAITEGMELQLIVLGAVILGFGWLGELIVPTVFGQRWMPMFEVFPYIGLSYITLSTFNMHTAALSVLNKNSLLAVYQFINVAFFAICVAVLVRFFGIKGYGLAELAALACYAILHLFVAKQVGSPDYRLTALWWSAAALGLFWHQLGVWTIALPFVVLLLPISLRRVTSVAQQMQAAFFKKKAPAA